MPANSKAAQRFRANMKVLLAQHKATITDVAEKLGMSRPALSRVLHGHDDLTLARGEKIAAYFGLELHQITAPQKNLKNTA